MPRRKPLPAASLKVLEEHKINGSELALIRKNVYVDNVHGKGKGVRAKKMLQPWSYVGSLAGSVYDYDEWEAMQDRGSITGNYGMDLPDDKIVDIEVPMDQPGSPRLQRKHEHAVAHRINEPGPRQRVSAAFVLNHATRSDAPRMDVYTTRKVPKGREITIHYGDLYEPIRREHGYPAPKEDAAPTYNIDLDPTTGAPVWREQSLGPELTSVSSNETQT